MAIAGTEMPLANEPDEDQTGVDMIVRSCSRHGRRRKRRPRPHCAMKKHGKEPIWRRGGPLVPSRI
jgi:hypothetical protein